MSRPHRYTVPSVVETPDPRLVRSGGSTARCDDNRRADAGRALTQPERVRASLLRCAYRRC